MVGRTNVFSGTQTSQWYAYIQVSTDANAVITAVNPAGNSYTKTADSTGSAIFIVAYPGTYTISETGATSQTVVVADYGVAYSVSIHIPTFNGILINDGAEVVDFSEYGYHYSSYNERTPYVLQNMGYTVGGVLYNTVYIEMSSGYSGLYISTNAYDRSGYSNLIAKGIKSNGIFYPVAVSKNSLTIQALSYSMSSSWGDITVSLSGLDDYGEYRFGILAIGSSETTATCYLNSLKIQ